MPNPVHRLAGTRDDRGASAVEYGLLVGAVAALIVVIVFALGDIIRGGFTATCTEIGMSGTATTASCG